MLDKFTKSHLQSEIEKAAAGLEPAKSPIAKGVPWTNLATPPGQNVGAAGIEPAICGLANRCCILTQLHAHLKFALVLDATNTRAFFNTLFTEHLPSFYSDIWRNSVLYSCSRLQFGHLSGV